MGFVKSKMVLFLLALATVLCSQAMAQSGCMRTLRSLAPCLNYVAGNSSRPSSQCCSQLDTTVRSSPQCLCSVINGGAPSIGININQTLAMQLPGVCNVQTPPIGQCKAAANGPATSANSPAGSPMDSPGADDTPGAAVTPSDADTPSGRRSKTIPSTDNGFSNANLAPAPSSLILTVAFVASAASVVI